MSKEKSLGMLDLNLIKLVLKPAVASKLNVAPSSLQWFMCRADVVKDSFDLSGWGKLKDSVEFKEVQLDGLKLSEHKIALDVFLKTVKKKGFDMAQVKSLHKFYFRVDYSECLCYSELFFEDKDGNKKKTPKITSKF